MCFLERCASEAEAVKQLALVRGRGPEVLEAVASARKLLGETIAALPRGKAGKGPR